MTKVWYENPPGSAPAQGLYSHVGLAQGGTLAFVAGQLAVGPEGAIVGRNDFAAQFAQVFRNLGDVLKGMGADFRRVVKFSTYLVHSQDIDAFMALRRELFPKLFGPGPYPPNTLLIVDRLVNEAFLIEIEAIVALDRPSG
jgi:enamine deaminase RidA (YjgF/YER057c/UK114 family)